MSKDKKERRHRFTNPLRSLFASEATPQFLTLDEATRAPDYLPCGECGSPTYKRENGWVAACPKCEKERKVTITLAL